MCAYTRCVSVAGYNKRCTKRSLVGIHLILIIVVEISDSSQVERTQQTYVVTSWGGDCLGLSVNNAQHTDENQSHQCAYVT